MFFKILLGAIALMLTREIALFFSAKDNAIIAKQYKQKNIVRCGPDWQMLNNLPEEDIPLVPGSGTHKWKINVNNDSAQAYFDQGMNMYYSFHIIEAMASFKKAARLNDNNAMLHWAQALAYGPNINDIGYAASPEALAEMDKAIALAATCSEKEKMLISAMQVRYSTDSTQTREHLNQLYVDKMKAAYEKYPADPDVAALYADALMLQHPWDLWNVNGTPKPWTPAIRLILEKLLAKFPDHPGANHYYIHVMEPSPYFAKALPAAMRLGKITPALSHTVHMPSHIFLRTGDYKLGAEVNENAVAGYEKMKQLYSPVTANDFLYLIHNLHMQTNNAMLDGRSAYSLQSALATRSSIPKDYLQAPGGMGNYIQYLYMTPVLTQVRFGKWDELLAATSPDPSLVYASILHYMGSGMAMVKRNRIRDAKEVLEKINKLIADSSLLAPFTPFSPAIDGARIAQQMLAGTILLAEKNYADAITAFKKASTIEENMVYNEPRDWMLNPKHYLADALLKEGDWQEAEKALEKDLLNNNKNYWALNGLFIALKAQKKNKKAMVVLSQVNAAKDRADINLNSSVL